MHPHTAYGQHKQRPLSRVDLIITSYRKGIERLERAEGFLAEQRREAALPLLVEAQTIVASLASGMAGNTDASALRFFRLYEFVCRMIADATNDSLRSARRVLTPLLEAFEAVRSEAVALESQGLISPLERERQLQLTV